MKKIHLFLVLTICLFYLGCERAKKTVEPKEEVPEVTVKEESEVVKKEIPEYAKEEAPEVEKKETEELEMSELLKLSEEDIAKELWQKIQRENYQHNWKLWPGKKTFYEAKEPHGPLLTTYVNDISYDTIINKKGKMPFDAIIITENYTSDNSLISITAMQKIKGFNPVNNDWFWVKFEPSGKVMTMRADDKIIQLTGRIVTCIECHGKQAHNDYIFTSILRDIEQETLEAKKREEEEVNAIRIAKELWDKMKEEDYQANWQMWPGKEAFYEAKQPHGTLLTTYINDTARDTILNKKEIMPPGAIIIAENYTLGKSLVSTIVMQKIKGFDPQTHDWFWVKFDPDGNIMTEKKYGEIILLAGKVARCIECHREKAGNDFIFTSPLKETEKVEEVTPEVKRIEEISEAEKMANELWNKLQTENYRKIWQMWPGKQAFYEGKEPHGSFLTTFVNDIAHEIIKYKKGEMPPGAIIIKENYRPDKNIESITVMQKIKDFNPDSNDWFWVKYDLSGNVMTVKREGETIKLVGKIASCIECHGKQTSNDYIMTSPLKLEHMY